MNVERIEITAEYLTQQGLSPTFPERFWRHVLITPTHWLWQGHLGDRGHGVAWRGFTYKTTWPNCIHAHRASWILHRGPIPEGMLVLHKCPGRHVSNCVNPDHLSLGDHAENGRDLSRQIAEGYLPKPINLSGERCSASKLTQQQADEIWEKYTGIKGQLSSLAKAFGISQGRVANLMIRGGWGHEGPHPAFVERQARIQMEKGRPKKPRFGEGCGGAKLTSDQVQAIRRKYTGKRGEQSALAREFGVRQGNIWAIVNHVTRARG